ncbi:OmpA-OmpF porin, OOP family [Janthinobacterium sp. CG_23.3]|uniref:outer membrane beta-barrel protein n=1 Tax=Janthinobacterium sp. CG_23.3 TaxID=3349634 RepID=UPI0038D380E3
MKQALSIALLAAALTIPFAAQAQSAYAGASVGGVGLNIDSHDKTSSGNNFGGKLYGGYQFNPTFGVEAGYAILGDHDASVNGVDGAHIMPSALYVAGTATMPVSEQFSVFGKVGVTANRNRFELPGGIQTLKYRNNSPLFGVGASYNFTPTLALVAEYEHFGKVQSADRTTIKAQMLSAGLRYKF